jgi:threonine dehydrogenase-like Zn-dependent dehydrogenase
MRSRPGARPSGIVVRPNPSAIRCSFVSQSRALCTTRARGADLALPYPWMMRNSVTLSGQWMYPRTANAGVIRLIASGALDFAPEQVTRFALDRVNDAIAHAAAHGGPFDRTVLTPAA